MSNVELVRTVYTYTIAALIVVGSGLLLILPTRIPAEQLLPFVTGIDGTVLGFVFSDRSAAASASRTLTALRMPPPAPLTGQADDLG